jgi:hypothetical protein
MQQQEGDDGYAKLQVFVFTNSHGDSDFATNLLNRMKADHTEGHFRFAARCDRIPNDGNSEDDGFDAFVVLDFNDPDPEAARALASTYLESDIAFGTKRGIYGLKHI